LISRILKRNKLRQQIKKCPARILNFPVKSRFFRYLRDLRCMRKFENIGTV